MHQHERTLTDWAEPSARPGVKADVTLGPPVQGDFAAGLRTRARAADSHGTFATGMCQSSAPAAGTVGDFASGARSHSGAPATGDFATGMRARDAGRTRPGGVERSRSEREHEQARWATA